MERYYVTREPTSSEMREVHSKAADICGQTGKESSWGSALPATTRKGFRGVIDDFYICPDA